MSERDAARERAWSIHPKYDCGERNCRCERRGFDAGFEAGQQDAGQWVPCTVRLPNDLPEVLVTTLTGIVDHGYCINGQWYDDADSEWTFDPPIAWMPLPHPYTPEEK